MNLKNTALVAALVLGTGAMAQKGQKHETARPADRTELMITELGLEGKQIKQYRELMAKNRVQVKELRQAEREGSREKAEALRARHDAELKELLTAEQWETYQTKKATMRAKSIERAERMKAKQASPEEPAKLKQSIK